MSDRKPTLTLLPGQHFVRGASELRQQLRNDSAMLESAAAFLNDPEASVKFDARLLASAASIDVIVSFWKFLHDFAQDKAVTFMRAVDGRKRPSTKSFVFCHLAMLKAAQRLFASGIQERYRAKEMTIEDDLFAISSIGLSKALPEFETKGVAIISMDDLVMFFGRLVGAAEHTYARTFGVEPQHADIVGLMRHSSVRLLLVSFMTNSRAALYPLIALLEGEKQPNLNDIDREFRDEYFEIRESDGVRSLHLKAEFVQGYRRRCEAELSSPQAKAYGCPVLHTGLFYEMYEWLLGRYEKWIQEDQALQAAE